MEQKKHILLVDDATTNLKLAEEVLKDTYTLSMAKSGKQALQLLRRTIPDLILLDIMMPEMDGYETLREIRQVPDCKDVPVVFLTADCDNKSEIKGLEMGAMDYIRKPFEPDLMLSRISRILRLSEDKKALELRASKDVLTSLWNRNYMEKYLDRMRYDQVRGSFLLLDLDNFKKINDTYGHMVGDEVLVRFANVLKANLQKDEAACRIGGDEFVVVLLSDAEDEELIPRIEKIIDEVNVQVNVAKMEYKDVSVSVGVALIPEDGEDFQTLYNLADKALYHVKQNGKCGYHFYNDKEKSSILGKDSVYTNVLTMDQVADITMLYSAQKGAFRVEFECFKKIVEFISRGVSRANQDIQMVLFTFNAENGEKEPVDVAVHKMSQAFREQLRRGDVFTQYGSRQLLLVLRDTNEEYADREVQRILNKVYESVDKDEVQIEYVIRTIQKDATIGK